MKRLVAILLTAVLLISMAGCGVAPVSGAGWSALLDGEMQPAAGSGGLVLKSAASQEMRGVWVSYLEFYNLVKDNFRDNVEDLLDNVKDLGCNTVFVQVRPYSDALYRSKYFPWSHVLTGEQGKDPGYDPLEIFVEEGHQRDLEIHAWINPYRITDSGNWELSSDNPAVTLQEQGDDYVLASGNGLYYNPARSTVRSLVIKGVLEIINNYEVDGIHFDDYFYPTQDASFDQKTYEELGAGRSLGDFRRAQVNTLVYNTYRAIKAVNPQISFGISPAADIEKNREQLYSDVEKWGSQSGYVDYLCPQIYFGFDHETLPFDQVASQWNNLVTSPSVSLYIGLAAYKVGAEDTYAGEAGKSEWLDSQDLLVRQIKYARNLRKYRGFALYRYESLYEPAQSVQAAVLKERVALKRLLQG